MQRTPITAPGGAAGQQQLLANLAALKRTKSPAIESHYDMQPVVDVYATSGPARPGEFRGGRDENHRQRCARNCRGEPRSTCADRWIRCGLRSRVWAWE